MEVSFAKDGSAATPVIPVTAPAEEAPPVPPVTGGPVTTTGPILGDKLPTFKEIVIPHLNIVQNIGPMTDNFNSGELVYDQRKVLYTPPVVTKEGVVKSPGTPPLNLTVLGFEDTRYVEKVAGGGRGLILNTEAQVTAAGGTLDYNEFKLKEKDGMKRFDYMATAIVAIRRPTDQVDGKDRIPDDDSVFVFGVDGAKYLLAKWSMKASVYTAAAKKVFFTARKMGCLRQGGYPSWNYDITTWEASFPGGNRSWVPKCEPTKTNTPEFLAWVRDILSLA